MTAPIIEGAEPFSAEGGPHGALVLHGFTGNPQSMKGIARALAGAGHAVECPRLPGHGTAIEDMLDTTWADWSAAAEAALESLQARLGEGGRIVVAGLSMGGTLTAWLATRHPELAGIALVNALAEPPGDLRALVDGAIAEGTETFPGIGSDIALEGSVESAYEASPLRPLRSLLDAVEALQPDLPSIACPVLLLTSPQDHVVPASNSDHLAAAVGGAVERVTLERSYHVATLDHDADLIEQRIVEFAAKCFAG
ncbi:MAG: alpha/beta fold hydrolase [Acidimicrobiia bacterium]|nr:alpha/beta fold hydrolase [Acidimicrobiia bacterium]